MQGEKDLNAGIKSKLWNKTIEELGFDPEDYDKDKFVEALKIANRVRNKTRARTPQEEYKAYKDGLSKANGNIITYNKFLIVLFHFNREYHMIKKAEENEVSEIDRAKIVLSDMNKNESKRV